MSRIGRGSTAASQGRLQRGVLADACGKRNAQHKEEERPETHPTHNCTLSNSWRQGAPQAKGVATTRCAPRTLNLTSRMQLGAQRGI
jgi:hypothetical protein